MLLAGCGPAPAPDRLQIVPDATDPAKLAVVLTGEGATKLKSYVGGATSGERLDRVFTLRVKAGDGEVIPPVFARVEWTASEARLLPQVSITRGVTYEASFAADQVSPGSPPLSAEYTLPEDRTSSQARITQIYPVQAVLPANLLKFYVQFSQPMAEGKVFQHVRLLDAKGKSIAQAFHEVELWDDNHRRLTLLINPGRTKRHLGLSESLGPVLREKEAYTLQIQAGLPDQSGRPLAKAFTHPFRTAGFDREQPHLDRWQIVPPHAGKQGELHVIFDDALDHALASRVIQVLDGQGNPVPGETRVDDEARQWNFMPASPWKPGSYKLEAAGELEDRAGNNLARPFETMDPAEKPVPTPQYFRRSFQVR